ncbi:MAG TPA: heparan-alpha-glucosaminide N-acetyltransferase [Devosia sp.]|nr:heparan-alpha-glucosaminide N-acetyltransferase [Devosia sp.]
MAGAGKGRLQAVDVYRGLALLAMAAYHALWDLNYYGLIEVGIGIDPVWISLQRGILTAFLLLAGASLTLAHGQGIRWRSFFRREALLVAAALAVSAGTWVLFQSAFAWFGVLHLIALGSLICLPFAVAPLWAGILAAIGLLALPALYSSALFDPPWLDWIGFFATTPETADLVPVFPWAGVMLIGVLGMRVLGERPAFTWSSGSAAARALAALGRWSLVFYLLHQPVLFGLVTPIAGWVNTAEQARLTGFTQSCMASCLSGQGKAEGGGAAQFCTNYCRCALDMTVRDNLWNAPSAELKAMSGLCTAMSE